MSENNVIPIQEKLSFNDIFDQNTVKQIKWGDEFKAWPMEKQLDYAKKLASAMNEAAAKMQEDRDRILVLLDKAHQDVCNAEEAMAISKSTMTQAILDSNQEMAQLNALVGKLQTEVKAKECVIESLNMRLNPGT